MMNNRRRAAGHSNEIQSITGSSTDELSEEGAVTTGTTAYSTYTTSSETESSAPHPSATSYEISRFSTLNDSIIHHIETNVITTKDEVWLEAVKEYLEQEPAYRPPFKKVKVVRRISVPKRSKASYTTAYKRYLRRKLVQAIPRALSNSVRRGFGGGAGHHEHTHEHPLKVKETEITQETLDRYNNIFPAPTKSESTFALHNVISQVPGVKSKGFVEFMAENFGQAKTESDVEYYIPPKVHENSVFLYQSKELANAVRKFRACEWGGLFFFGALMHQPLFAIPTFAAFYVVYGNALFYELSRRLVTRMDLLPHLEMVQIQKVSAFGTVYSKLIRIDDLEKVDSDIAMTKENMFWGLNKTNVDPYLIFRVKSTGEVLCFDRDGYWDYNGISHELIN